MKERNKTNVTEAIMNLLNSSTQEGSQYVTFFIGEEEYGIKIQAVQEICPLKELTHLPNTPEYISGILNLRGNVIPVIDLRLVFHLPKIEATRSSVIIILKNNDKINGLLIDQISDVMTIDSEHVEETPDMALSINSSFIDGIAKLNDRFIILLDMIKVFKNMEHQNE